MVTYTTKVLIPFKLEPEKDVGFLPFTGVGVSTRNIKKL